MNPQYVAIVTGLVIAIGQLTKFTMKLEGSPRYFPLAMVFAGILMGIIIDFSLSGVVDGLVGGLSAMGFYSGTKHIKTGSKSDLEVGRW